MNKEIFDIKLFDIHLTFVIWILKFYSAIERILIMSFSWKKLKRPFAGLAPMADYTDSPFSLICKEFGADIIYREMVSADALIHQNKRTLLMADFDKRERPIILQIFGKDPEVMAKAARILEDKYKPDGIDINMGCPARKIVGNFNGASLMKEPALAAKIIKAVKSAVACPVSVKTRTGWESEMEILKFSKIIEEAGADAIAIHGRTKKQGYNSKANWEIIRQVKNILKIPVILNGDVTDYKSFKEAINISGADGVLIGRGALGNPWIFKNIQSRKDIAPANEEIKKIILKHAKLHFSCYGELISFRKHVVSYFKGQEGAKKIRTELVKIKNLEELEEILKG